ncbi:MAG: hypothetical protein JO257_36390 [Deltaproteobacteria bacterium]|nr:hypothetical protein [Deltaproteobacteria bacterium]
MRGSTVVVVLLAVGSAASADPKPTSQTPEQLCSCRGDASARKGGIATVDAFHKKYGGTFKSADEEKLAWAVYQATNRCDSTMVIGRLEDTGSFFQKPGYCVLRDLKPWTIAINDVFIHAGTDRQAMFLLVSPMPLEKQSDAGDSFPVVYNREMREVEDTHRYKLSGQPDKFSTAKPGHLDPMPCYDVSGTWTGSLTVSDVHGASNIQPGQRRNGVVTIEQEGCRVHLKFATNELAGYLIPTEGPPLVAGLLDEVIAGALVKADVTIPPRGPLQVQLEQQAAAASITSTGRLKHGH